MNQVSILVEGFAREWGGGGYELSPSVTLIQTGRLKIVCDPGFNVDLVEKGLKEKGLKFKDIDWVFLTHAHLITSFAVSRFTNARVIDAHNIYWPWAGKLEPHQGKIPETDLNIMLTPGHEVNHASLLVPVENLVYAVAGDVFWWDEYEEQLTDRQSLLKKKDTLAVDEKALRKSREKILAIADFIIPGHGKMFKVER